MGSRVIPKQDRDPESIAHLNANLIKQQFLALKKNLEQSSHSEKAQSLRKKLLI